ncbi:MAG: aminoacyl-tRNA hydrolase [Candidatus Coatesbacteria bacterium]|nr:MAG: aminoacyl-tRNA hydrolase [Candidatus Coatesbacteria bacterium]
MGRASLWAHLRRRRTFANAQDFLVVGLGNPGSEYVSTRHNAGFMSLDILAGAQDVRFRHFGQGEAVVWHVDGKRGVLAKPMTYVNNSGSYVKFLITRLGIAVDKVLVVHDDITLDIGQYKFKFGGGSAGHKGLISIIESLGTAEFYRLRIGIGRPPRGDSRVEWVLSAFAEEQLGPLSEALQRCSTAVADFAIQGGVAAMNIHNKRTKERKLC